MLYASTGWNGKNNVYNLLEEETNVSDPSNNKEEELPSECSLKRKLANSGYSKTIANKVWKWYNPPEIDNAKSNR